MQCPLYFLDCVSGIAQIVYSCDIMLYLDLNHIQNVLRPKYMNIYFLLFTANPVFSPFNVTNLLYKVHVNVDSRRRLEYKMSISINYNQGLARLHTFLTCCFLHAISTRLKGHMRIIVIDLY